MRIALEVRPNGFVCAVGKAYATSVVVGSKKPIGGWVARINGQPMRPMACHEVRIAAGDCSWRRYLASFCIVAAVELSIRDCTACAIHFHRCQSTSPKHPIHAGTDFWKNGFYMLAVEFAAEQGRYLLHGFPSVVLPQCACARVRWNPRSVLVRLSANSAGGGKPASTNARCGVMNGSIAWAPGRRNGECCQCGNGECCQCAIVANAQYPIADDAPRSSRLRVRLRAP